jgi:hypothetical protein
LKKIHPSVLTRGEKRMCLDMRRYELMSKEKAKEVGLEETPFHIKVTVPSLRLEIDVVAVGDPALAVMVAGGVVNFLRINDMEPKVVILP